MDKSGKTGRRYSAEEKAAAVRMVRTLRVELGTDRGTAQRVALQLGYGMESVRSCVRQAYLDNVAARRNSRPRKTLNSDNLADRLQSLLRCQVESTASFFGAEPGRQHR